jgi:hypothetical protein
MKIIRNEELRGLEIYFDEKPQTEVLSTLKAEGFRWHRIKKCWYNKISDAVLKIAESLANGQVLTTTKATKAERQPKTAINKYGVKVGDIFYMSWGYEQTNLEFFCSR